VKQRNILSIVVPIVLLAVWQIVGSRPGMQAMLPSPSLVLSAWYEWIFGQAGMGLDVYKGTWLANVQYSASRVVVGFVMAMVVAIPLGLMIGWSRITAVMLDPMVQMFRPIPITAWLPFSIAAFGITNMGSISLIFLGGFFAIVVNATQGARDVDKNLVRAALMMGASPWTLLMRVILPAALPNIFTGMRIGLGIAWTAVVAAEMVAVVVLHHHRLRTALPRVLSGPRQLRRDEGLDAVEPVRGRAGGRGSTCSRAARAARGAARR
jgi:NitT/TauT family transport system permease protein